MAVYLGPRLSEGKQLVDQERRRQAEESMNVDRVSLADLKTRDFIV